MQKPQIRTSKQARRWRLSIAMDGQVELTVPAGAPHRLIDEVLHTHREWIARHQNHQRDRFAGVEQIYADHGGLMPYLDQWLPLSKKPERFYRQAAARFFQVECERVCETIGQPYRRITIRDPKTRWGSCSARGNLSFSWRLLKAPLFVARYVAVHECAHLIHPNHSARFWQLVDRLCSDRTAAQRWLKEQAAFLHYDPWVSDG
jgi:predicted metal-dependent hydrolase